MRLPFPGTRVRIPPSPLLKRILQAGFFLLIIIYNNNVTTTPQKNNTIECYAVVNRQVIASNPWSGIEEYNAADSGPVISAGTFCGSLAIHTAG